MADTGYSWGTYQQCGVEEEVLTTGGTIELTTDAIDLTGKAACLISIGATYSNHAKATGGLEVCLLDAHADASYQDHDDVGTGLEMIFAQNDARVLVFPVDPKHHDLIKVLCDWNNTTADSNVTITIRYKTATIPVAS